jgi:hypothetical protein
MRVVLSYFLDVAAFSWTWPQQEKPDENSDSHPPPWRRGPEGMHRTQIKKRKRKTKIKEINKSLSFFLSPISRTNIGKCCASEHS